MKQDIIIIGAGASGLMAAYGAAKAFADAGVSAGVTILEKMPRPGRKIMISGKGRCNITNVKNWNDFQLHIRSKAQFVKSSFYNFNSEAVLEFFEQNGVPTVVERGDRAFPQSYRASDVVDALVRACQGYGVKLETEQEVKSIEKLGDNYKITTAIGAEYIARAIIIATGGLSYPGTGSTGDGYAWAASFGHKIVPTFPSLTALVPKGYKQTAGRGHINRSTSLSEFGEALCGIQLKNVGVQALVNEVVAEDEFGDIDFTDGGIEGPIGFQLSRKCVKSIVNGSRVALLIDTKPGVEITALLTRIKTLWDEISRDPRSRNMRDRDKYKVLLGKLLPRDSITGFTMSNPDIVVLERRGRTESKLYVNLSQLAQCLKEWRFEIDGYVGYERAVVTAGGVDTDEIIAKTMESRLSKGLFFCGELMDMDSDTGGYNLQTAFSTGLLAGQSAAKSLIP